MYQVLQEIFQRWMNTLETEQLPLSLKNMISVFYKKCELLNNKTKCHYCYACSYPRKKCPLICHVHTAITNPYRFFIFRHQHNILNLLLIRLYTIILG